MKKWIWILIFILLFFLIFCQKQKEEAPANVEKPQQKEEISTVAQEVENKIQTAISSLAEGKLAEGANLLLDAILLTKPSGSWPDNVEDSILAAKKQFHDMNIQKGVESISDALQVMKPTPEMPKEKVKDEPAQIAPLAEIMRDKILKAREEFMEGNADKGIILILEALRLLAPRSS